MSPASAWLTVACLALAISCCAQDAPEGMALVPSGEFTLGSDGKAIDEDAMERPPHSVSLAAYFIDKHEVTVAEYAGFLNAAQATAEGQGRPFLGLAAYSPLEQANGEWRAKSGRERFPMTNVTWYGAVAFAKWAGKRLPTEAEWEKAARGSDGRKFPWGAGMDPSRMRFGQDNIGPVGEKANGASPYGCLDMAGNAWEWTSSLFKPYPYAAEDGREDPETAGRRVARGGSWTGEPHIATTTYRFRPEPGFAHAYLGFRCAKDLP